MLQNFFLNLPPQTVQGVKLLPRIKSNDNLTNVLNLVHYRYLDGVVPTVVDDGQQKDACHGHHGRNAEGDDGHV